MNNQLNNISTQYRKFSKGQPVDHEQFNEFLDFFEDQDRLSRVTLQGVGIVCGLQPQLTYSEKILTGIELSHGIAITTDGDLLTLSENSIKNISHSDLYASNVKTISLPKVDYTHFKPYDDATVKYPAFHNESGKQIELWELATGTQAKTGFQPVAGLGNIEDKYLLLYQQAYEKEIKPCRGVDCDNHGIQQVRNLKVLVTTGAGLSQILKNDRMYLHPAFPGSEGDIRVKRIILKPETASVQSLARAYREVTDSSSYESMFQNIDAISKIINVPLTDRTNFTATLNALQERDTGFQYTYGVLKDLTDTYTEILRLLPKSFTRCLPDLFSFPKHIMLGKLLPDTKSAYARHQFYSSPALDKKRDADRITLLLERFNQQILQFKDPLETGGKVKITPSVKTGPLGNMAIPFYYNLTEGLLKAWDFEKTKNRNPGNNISYAMSMLSGNTPREPMLYNMDKNSFYRIEGHQGMDYTTVVDSIKEIKDRQQLGFDVVALSLEELYGNKDSSKAYLTTYIEKHPGLEFLAGVQRGGTFAVVYESETNPIVVADFSLPYLCCTPKSNTGLSLPSGTICEDAAPMIFNVRPSNAIVQADVAENVSGGVEKINGQYVFNPKKLDKALHNEEIRFTVNGKPTTCSVRVVQQPEAEIKVKAIVEPEPGMFNTSVYFTVTGDDDTTYDYKWDFLGNGSFISMQPDAEGTVKYTYNNLDSKNIPKIKVLVSANGCSQTSLLTDWYRPQTENNIPPKVRIESGSTAIFLPHPGIMLSSIAVSGTGAIIDYSWSSSSSNVLFLTPNAPETTVNFSSPGIYPVIVTVKDSNGLEASATVSITVSQKARITNITIAPANPTADSSIIAKATVSNPSNVTDLKFDWYLNERLLGQTSQDQYSFGNLTPGNHVIGVAMSGSRDANHYTDTKTFNFIVEKGASVLGTSFVAGTTITLENRQTTEVERLKGGEVLQSLNGTVKVINVTRYVSEERLYRLNEDKYFITQTNPVYTTGEWKSFAPEKSNEMLEFVTVGVLEVGDVLIKEGNLESPLTNTDSVQGPHEVYNIEVDGERNFFANGYCVHSEKVNL